MSQPDVVPTITPIHANDPFSVGSVSVGYVYVIDDEPHAGLVKHGDTQLKLTCSLDDFMKVQTVSEDGFVRSPQITAKAHERIMNQVRTAAVAYQLLDAFLLVRADTDAEGHTSYKTFRDKAVHRALSRIGIRHTVVHSADHSTEWFTGDLAMIHRAVKSVMTGQSALDPVETDIVLRAEQQAAIDAASAYFKKSTQLASPREFLWSAIMRFGKTVTALELVKQRDDIRKVLILTHRPVLRSNWFEDYVKVFGTDEGFGTRNTLGQSFEEVSTNDEFVYFASIQDMRGYSTKEKTSNDPIYDVEWDLVIVDEAHEGTTTALARRMKDRLDSRFWLYLSGTPFNISDDFADDAVFVYSYIDECRAKLSWPVEHPDQPNPYADNPYLSISAYQMPEELEARFGREEGFFNFREMFRASHIDPVSGVPVFDHETEVLRFLDLISTSASVASDQRGYPFENGLFAHTLWHLPGVNAVRAMEALLKRHNFFSTYAVANVAGDMGNERRDALELVHQVIRRNDRSITLTCGRLTTGTTIPEWTGVMMLSNMSDAKNYMQTIFRVKSAGLLKDGSRKTEGHVFDFAPNRALQVLADAASNSRTNRDDATADIDVTVEDTRELLEFLPIFVKDGGNFTKVSAVQLTDAVNHAFIARTERSGFTDPRMFDRKAVENALVDGSVDADLLARLKFALGNGRKGTEKPKIEVTSTSTPIPTHPGAGGDGKNGQDATPETPEATDAREAERKRRQLNEEVRNFRSLLFQMTSRIPLLVAFAPVTDESKLQVATLAQAVDDVSWMEFMPKGADKQLWNDSIKFMNQPVVNGAIRRYRGRVKEIFATPDGWDATTPIGWFIELTKLFHDLKNPDKETVLTPGGVVQQQLTDTIGGPVMLPSIFAKAAEDDLSALEVEGVQLLTDEDEIPSERLTAPQEGIGDWVSQNLDEEFWNNPDAKVLEVNSKTALYPLYVAVGLWLKACQDTRALRRLGYDGLWRDVVENQIFVNTRTPLAAQIARQVLSGFDGSIHVNVSVVDMVEVKNILTDSLTGYWNKDEFTKAKLWNWLFDPNDFDNVSSRLAQLQEVAKASIDNQKKETDEQRGELA